MVDRAILPILSLLVLALLLAYCAVPAPVLSLELSSVEQDSPQVVKVSNQEGRGR